MEELFDTYDISGNFLGIKTKTFCHSKNPCCYHKPVWIWIINNKNEIMVQKRASTKKTSPNKFDMACAGHIIAGEKILEACVRETKEELGILTKENDYIFLGEYINKKGWEIAEIFLLKTNNKISDFKIQNEEVSEIRFLNYNQFIKLFYSNEFCNHDLEYKNFICDELKKHF